MTVSDFKTLLVNNLNCPIYHDKALQEDGNYIVWETVKQHSLVADNRHIEISTIIDVNFYTENEYSDTPYKIEQLFDDNDICFDDRVDDFDEESGQKRYIWTVEI